MNKKEANKKAKMIFDDWHRQRNLIEKEAKENGTWQYGGLDTNTELFIKVNEEAKKKLQEISLLVDE